MKKTIFVLRHRLSIPLILVLAYAGTGIAGAQTTPHHFDGEAVFRGLMLGEGPVAKLFPEYYAEQETAHQKEAAAKARQHMVDAFRAEDTAFFDHWGKDIQSGDRARIGKALGEVHKRLKSLAENTPGTVHGYGQGNYQSGLMFSMHQLSEFEQDVLIDRIAKRLGPVGTSSKK